MRWFNRKPSTTRASLPLLAVCSLLHGAVTARSDVLEWRGSPAGGDLAARSWSVGPQTPLRTPRPGDALVVPGGNYSLSQDLDVQWIRFDGPTTLSLQSTLALDAGVGFGMDGSLTLVSGTIRTQSVAIGGPVEVRDAGRWSAPLSLITIANGGRLRVADGGSFEAAEVVIRECGGPFEIENATVEIPRAVSSPCRFDAIDSGCLVSQPCETEDPLIRIGDGATLRTAHVALQTSHRDYGRQLRIEDGGVLEVSERVDLLCTRRDRMVVAAGGVLRAKRAWVAGDYVPGSPKDVTTVLTVQGEVEITEQLTISGVRGMELLHGSFVSAQRALIDGYVRVGEDGFSFGRSTELHVSERIRSVTGLIELRGGSIDCPLIELDEVATPLLFNDYAEADLDWGKDSVIDALRTTCESRKLGDDTLSWPDPTLLTYGLEPTRFPFADRGRLVGEGHVYGTVRNAGEIRPMKGSDGFNPSINIFGTLEQMPGGRIVTPMSTNRMRFLFDGIGAANPPTLFCWRAVLGGFLFVDPVEDVQYTVGSYHSVVDAHEVVGRFCRFPSATVPPERVAPGQPPMFLGQDSNDEYLRILVLRAPQRVVLGQEAGESLEHGLRSRNVLPLPGAPPISLPFTVPGGGLRAEKLALITHGTRGSLGTLQEDGFAAIGQEMMRFIEQRDPGSEWDVATLAWNEFCTGPDDPRAYLGQFAPSEAARIGRQIGISLVDWLVNEPTFPLDVREWHLLSTSSGSYLIDGISDRLREVESVRGLERARVNLTFWDPFHGWLLYGLEWSVSRLAEEKIIDHAEQYFDSGAPLRTESELTTAVNIDVTELNPDYGTYWSFIWQVWNWLDISASDHAWPYKWYLRTIKAVNSQPFEACRRDSSCEWQEWGFVLSPMYRDYAARNGVALPTSSTTKDGVTIELPDGDRSPRPRVSRVLDGVASDASLSSPVGAVARDSDGALLITAAPVGEVTWTVPSARPLMVARLRSEFVSGRGASVALQADGTRVWSVGQASTGLGNPVEDVVGVATIEGGEARFTLRVEASGDEAAVVKVAVLEFSEILPPEGDVVPPPPPPPPPDVEITAASTACPAASAALVSLSLAGLLLCAARAGRTVTTRFSVR